MLDLEDEQEQLPEPNIFRRFKMRCFDVIFYILSLPYRFFVRRLTHHGKAIYYDDLLLPVESILSDAIRRMTPEFNTLLKFREKIPPHHVATGFDHPASLSSHWRTLPLRVNGREIEENEAVFVETLKVVRAIPGCVNASYELVDPSTNIEMYHTKVPSLLRCLVPVELRDSEYPSSIEINKDKRKLQGFRMQIIDASIRQEYFNASEAAMLLLVIEIRRPHNWLLDLYNRFLLWIERGTTTYDRPKFCLHHYADLTLRRVGSVI